jgi:hypothetical protein
VLLLSDTHRKHITSITTVLLPFVTYLLTLPRILNTVMSPPHFNFHLSCSNVSLVSTPAATHNDRRNIGTGRFWVRISAGTPAVLRFSEGSTQSLHAKVTVVSRSDKDPWSLPTALLSFRTSRAARSRIAASVLTQAFRLGKYRYNISS